MLIGRNYLFVPVSKVASVSLANALKEHPIRFEHNPYKGYGLKKLADYTNSHVPISLVNERLSLPPLFKFGFVRNPFERFVSFAAWTKAHFRFDPLLQFHNNAKGYMHACLSSHDYLSTQTTHIWSQGRFLNDDGKLAVDYVGRYETLQEDFDYICDRIELPLTQLKVTNESHHQPDWRQYYDTSLVDKVSELYKDDIEQFGYKFE